AMDIADKDKEIIFLQDQITALKNKAELV
ncbi:hypothetical protein LCGC14_2327420, partial [marine sediment metagenome]